MAINNQTHFDKTNYDDIFLRCVITGFLGYLRERFILTQYSLENGKKEYVLPIHYSLTGDDRYIMEGFYDDIPDKRVNTNTDSIPRGIITLKSWSVKNDEFTNPNIWFNVHKEVDEEIVQYATQIKSVPVKLTFTLDTLVDNEIDVFKCWQIYMQNMWIYKYFTFDYLHLPINAVFNFIGDTDSPITREFKFGDVQVLKTTYTFDIHTFFPITDLQDLYLGGNNNPGLGGNPKLPNAGGIPANEGVQWILNIWKNKSNTNLPPLT
jgi:hypothetical protein